MRSSAGPQDIAIMRHMGTSLLHRPKDKHSLKVRGKSAAWDASHLETLLRQSPRTPSGDCTAGTTALRPASGALNPGNAGPGRLSLAGPRFQA